MTKQATELINLCCQQRVFQGRNAVFVHLTKLRKWKFVPYVIKKYSVYY